MISQEKEDVATKNHSDFSIEHILKYAGEKSKTGVSGCAEDDRSRKLETLPWLQCTRFCPPRVPRTHRREGPQKRQLGKYPRIPFTNQQTVILEERFQQSPYLSSEEAIELSRKLQLSDVKVKIWFQNRRARKRREEIGELKSQPKNDEVPAVVPPVPSDAAASSGCSQVNIHVPFIYLNPNSLSNIRR